MPDIGEMARQAARHQEDGIDANVVTFSDIAGRQPLGGNDNASQAVLVQRKGRGFLCCPRLDLDKRDNPSASCNEIDFATRRLGAPRQDSPAMQAQPPGGDGFRLATALLRDNSPVQRPSSSARE